MVPWRLGVESRRNVDWHGAAVHIIRVEERKVARLSVLEELSVVEECAVGFGGFVTPGEGEALFLTGTSSGAKMACDCGDGSGDGRALCGGLSAPISRWGVC